MEKPVEHYWDIRLNEVKEALEANNFKVFLATNGDHAREIVLTKMLPESGAGRVSFGGSMTVIGTGVYDALKEMPELEVLDTYDRSISREEMLERRRQALLVDLFVCGTNAVTETGTLVNLDMIGNRIGGLTFGPKNVAVLVGRNKIVPDLEEAMFRIKNFVAPANAMRLDMNAPCVKTGYCEECNAPQRICNTWTITEKSFPRDRVRVILINEDIGL
ncbi:MAG: lactate utilization protein [Deltaproteobacteria bacterium]|nr:lactate utilization protein [Deltaproteobacteria bacterium]